MPHLCEVLCAPFPVKAKHWDSPSVLHFGIELAATVVVRNHATDVNQGEPGAKITTQALSQFLPIQGACRSRLGGP